MTAVAFVPKHGVTAKRNLAAYIKAGKGLVGVLGSNLDFDADEWTLDHSLNTKGMVEKKTIRFSDLASSRARIFDNFVPLHPDFKPFAKACCCHLQSINRVTVTGINLRLKGLRLLEMALLQDEHADPTKINALVLNRAAAIAQEVYPAGSTAYSVGKELERLARHIDDNRLTPPPCNWKCPIRNTGNDATRAKFGEIYDARREKLLPSQELVEATAQAFALARDVMDVVPSAICALLFSAPSRVCEAVTLPLNCLAPRGDGKPGLSLRWFPAKGGAPLTKPVPEPMVDTAIEAVERLRRVSAQARVIAQWYEQNPTRVFLPPELEYLRKRTLLSMREVGLILWGDDAKTRKYTDNRQNVRVNSALKRLKVTLPKLSFKKWKKVEESALHVPRIPFAEIERGIVALLPAGFPIRDIDTGLRYSDALCLLRLDEIDARAATWQCMITPVTPSHIDGRLQSSHNSPSMYERLGIRDHEGALFKFCSHQARHFLNTLGGSVNMDPFDIAIWSGRANVQHNRSYDHNSATDTAKKIQAVIEQTTGTHLPPAMQGKSTYIPILRSEYLGRKIQSGHTTDLGHCVLDFSLMPCPRFGHHINCEEHVIQKGNPVHEANIRTSYGEAQQLYANAVAAYEGGNENAKIWLDEQQSVMEKFKQICDILDDPTVEEGSLIRLSIPDSPSRIKDAVNTRIAKRATEKPGQVPAPQSTVASKARLAAMPPLSMAVLKPGAKKGA